MLRRPPRSTLSSSSAASDVYKRQVSGLGTPAQWAVRLPPYHHPLELQTHQCVRVAAVWLPPTLDLSRLSECTGISSVWGLGQCGSLHTLNLHNTTAEASVTCLDWSISAARSSPAPHPQPQVLRVTATASVTCWGWGSAAPSTPSTSAVA
eukprot:TRINITY_DN18825_c0_g2_i1.p1 TRINITY_DN18825_c0_g2~~TRINITY_DN18825_c0_g2_i1.p1  ORF type:complete len:151 (+),score=13.96 TRINITY_DN18825_c0_g2_i1:62-514(+)